MPQRTPTTTKAESVRYSLEFDVAGRHIRLSNYACKTLEEAEIEIAQAFGVARSIRDGA